ncbi:copper resistance CopC family protein [Brachybacterium alimentarium]|uniref:copper resistance CopC family protein n=1 Tax=Brachybacterium alimentarium TaxID=47845 RepID=UPI003FD5D203
MPMTFRRASLRPLTLLALCAAMMVAVVTMLPAPALAHDTLISSDPAAGDTLETSPEAITLTYSDNVLEVSPVVRIVDESGETIADIEPTVEGPDVTATLEEPLPAGDYTVQWRVVSSDGHPIEGNLEISVEQDSTDQAAAPSDNGGADAAASDAGGEQSSAPSAEEAPEQESSSMPILLGVVGGVVVIAALVAFFVLRKRS